MKNDYIKNEKNILITGGTRGIGQAIVNEFMKEKNYNIYVTGKTDIIEKNFQFNYLKCDFLETESFYNLIKTIANLKIDILINCAGINKIGELENYSTEDFLKLQKVNITAPFELCKAVLPFMKSQRWGRIINISSILGKIGKEYRSAYSATKFALDGLTVSLAAEVAEFGILANCVAPGFIETDLTRNILGEEGIKNVVKEIPMKRLGKPQEIAKLVYWLSSEENTYLTGQNIAIDGGFSRV